MGLFKKRVDYLPWQSGTEGATLRFDISREFHIEAIMLRVHFRVSVGATLPTPTRDSLAAIIKRIRLNVSDGARTRLPIDISGPGAMELNRMVYGGQDKQAQVLLYNQPPTASKHYIFDYCIPVWFAPPQVSDPLCNHFLLPAPRYNINPTLEIQLGTMSDLASANAPALDATDPSPFNAAQVFVSPMILRREVNVPNWVTFDTELAEWAWFPASTGLQTVELPVPGSYTGLLLRNYSTNGSARPLTRDGEIKLQVLGQVIRRGRWRDIQLENQLSVFYNQTGITMPNTLVNASTDLFTSTTADTATPGYSRPEIEPSIYLDFLSDRTGDTVGELGSVFDTNVFMATGARPQLSFDVQNSVTAGESRIQIVGHRIFGQLDALKLGPVA